MERRKVRKGFSDTAIRLTAIAGTIIVTLCVVSFGLTQLKPSGSNFNPDQSAESALARRQDSAASFAATHRAGLDPEPVARHLEQLEKQLKAISRNVSCDQDMRAKIGRLTNLIEAARQQDDLSDTRLHQEIGALRVNHEVELRDLNRQVGTVVEKSQKLERDILEHRTGVLSALENQRSTLEGQVARLEGGLKDVQFRLSTLPHEPKPAVAAAESNTIHSFAPLTEVPSRTSSTVIKPEASNPTWKKPVVLDAATAPELSDSEPASVSRKATSAGWKVSPMSHSTPAIRPSLPAPARPTLAPPAPSASGPADEKPSPLPKSLRPAAASPIRAPLKSTLAPPSAERRVRVPEIVEISHSADLERVSSESTVPALDQTDPKHDIRVSVIHVAATRPVDVEPAGVRMLNPELSTTSYGLPWTHEAVTHELLRKVSQRAQASIAGRQQVSARETAASEFSIGYSCLHCNELHGFEAGDRLKLESQSTDDANPRFHVVSSVSGSGRSLKSIPAFDLKPVPGQTYVISEEAVEGTIQETDPAIAQPEMQLMQRLVVITFVNNDSPTSSNAINTAASSKSTPETVVAKNTIALPSPESAPTMSVKKLKPVRQHPVFLPPPEPSHNARTLTTDSGIEFVGATLDSAESPQQTHRSPHQSSHSCEICERKHSASTSDPDVAETHAEDEQAGPLVSWFQRVSGRSSESETEVTTAEFEMNASKPVTIPMHAKNDHHRRYVTKPGNRRPVR